MPNSLADYEVYLPQVMDRVFASAALTAGFGGTVDGINIQRTPNPKVYNILQMSFGHGLGDYDRNNGFKAGKVVTSYVPLEVEVDRATSFSIDAVDDENAGQIAARVLAEFVRTKVVPETDAYRFAKLAGEAGNAVSAAITTAAAAWTAVQDGLDALFQAHAPRSGNTIYLTSAMMGLIDAKIGTNRQYTSQTIDTRTQIIDGNKYIVVPNDLFYSEVELADYNTNGTGGGFAASTGAVGLNFLIVNPSVVTVLNAHQKTRFFGPDVNQLADAYKIDYRLHHDLWVRPNGADGVFVNKKTA